VYVSEALWRFTGRTHRMYPFPPRLHTYSTSPCLMFVYTFLLPMNKFHKLIPLQQRWRKCETTCRQLVKTYPTKLAHIFGDWVLYIYKKLCRIYYVNFMYCMLIILLIIPDLLMLPYRYSYLYYYILLGMSGGMTSRWKTISKISMQPVR
jgi:hypothetical protein